ncbi:hypothetical protein O1L44_02800 [Streptomyces noursei]|uniref:hypothetical protein n=1 Tax=Streptomyces noursei TaxID=1971 RepID=UPI00081C992E|nr:hypothetical protein SNOUR_07885 [Streptomyces noursei ATCC 11455]MCZ0992290.1 hypothetical protein [Streptomyces noursei]
MNDATEQRRIGDPAPGVDRLSRKRLLIFVVLVLVIAVPSVFYFSGAYDRWKDERSLADICKGSVDTSEVKELLGADRLRGHDVAVEQGINPRAGQLHKCSVGDPDGRAWLSTAMDWSSGAAGALHDFGGFPPNGGLGMAIPLGHGWEGVMDEGRSGEGLVATVNMPCANHRNDPERSSLIVTLQGQAMRSMEGTAQRARFARTAVKTAQNAARAWGCNARPGGPIDRVPDNTAHTKVPQGEAGGSCAGIAAAVRESATDSNAPIENCYLLSDSNKPHYRLSAFYGPFVRALPAQLGYGDELDSEKSAGRKGSSVWATAECPSGGKALYIATALPDDGDRFTPDGQLEESTLKAFATRSAERHGCASLKMP